MELNNESIFAIISSGMLLAAWIIKRFFTRKEDTAKTDNIDSGTIQQLADAVATFQELHEELLIKYKQVNRNNSEQACELDRLKRNQNNIVEQNKALLEDNVRMKDSIRMVQKENESLREIVASEQLDKKRLKAGIQRLIKQMKENGIEEPAFIL